MDQACSPSTGDQAPPCSEVTEYANSRSLREQLSILAGIRSARNRQSPPCSGLWEYQRDRHPDGLRWEHDWIGELRPLGDDHRALLTTCGMAAINTVLAYLERSLPPAGPIVVDAGVYHETRHLLSTGGLAGRCVVVRSDRFIDAVRSYQPVAVIVDAISNRPEVRIADLEAVADVVSTSSPPVVVVDSSLCSMLDPWLFEALSAIEAPLIVVESLTKHAQLGLDRVPGGIIVADRTTAAALDRLREHLGSNITDLACAALPRPNRSLMLDRLGRQASNARIVAERLTAEGFEVVHPCLPHHPDHARWLADRQACGIIGLATTNGPRVIGDAIAAAARRGVLIENGVGFGFDTTRIYQTSRSVPEASVFFRVAVGLEPVDEIEQVAMALAEAMSGAMPR